MAYSESISADSPEDEGRVKEVRDKWKEAKEFSSAWREEARGCYGFIAGDQISPEDKAKLEEEGRPVVSFNRCGTMVEAVGGLEINNRQSIRYFPREVGDVKVNEMLTATSDWIRDETDAEDEESEAFRDAAICGVGCTETRMDYEEEQDGKVIDERRDPLCMFPGPGVKRGFKDSKFHFHAEYHDKKDVKARWPDKEISWSADDLGDQNPGDGDNSYKYDGDTYDADYRKGKVLVLHYQCCEKEVYYRLFDPFQQKNVELSEEDFKKLQKNGEKAGLTFAKASSASGDDIPYVKQSKKVYYRGFYCGATELEYGRSPIQSGFTFKYITAKRDRNKNCWYGIVRVMIDPQKWANKWLSQILHIVNSNAKGGAFIEENALVDKRKAEEQWAQASPLIMMTEGAVSGNKIKERTPAAYPTGLDRLMMFAFESMPFVTGINLEALGLANRDQAGVLEAQRRKAAMAILAPLFASLREFRKEKGRLYLEFIDKFIPDGTVIRVVGEKGAQYVKFAKSEEVQKHDVVIDEAPDSPDFKEKVWAGLQEVLPALLKQGVPIPAEVLTYAPLPSDVAESLQKAMQGSQPLPPEVQKKMEQMQAEGQKLAQENQALKEKNQLLQADQQTEAMKIQAKEQADRRGAAVKIEQAQIDAAVEGRVALIHASLEKWKTEQEQKTDLLIANIQAAAQVKAAKEKPRPTKQ